MKRFNFSIIVDGVITRANPKAVSNTERGLELVNKDPEGEGWLLEIEATSTKELSPATNSHLLDPDAYGELCEGEDH